MSARVRRLGPAGPWLLGAGYATALLVVDTLTRVLPDDGGAAARAWLSTNLDNLSSPLHGVAALLGSAFVAEESVGWWAVFAVAGLTVAGRRFGAVRAGALALAAHVLATLASEGLLALRIALGDAPAADRGLLDVGPSYLVLAALVAGTVYGRRWERVAPAVAFALVAPYLFGGLTDLDVTPVGHTASALIALGLGALARRARTSPVPAASAAS